LSFPQEAGLVYTTFRAKKQGNYGKILEVSLDKLRIDLAFDKKIV
jgi:hypothetical protein